MKATVKAESGAGKAGKAGAPAPAKAKGAAAVSGAAKGAPRGKGRGDAPASKKPKLDTLKGATVALIGMSERHTNRTHADMLARGTDAALPGDALTFAEKGQVLDSVALPIINLIGHPNGYAFRGAMIDRMVKAGVPKRDAINAIASFTPCTMPVCEIGTGKITGGGKAGAPRETVKTVKGRMPRPAANMPMGALRIIWGKLLAIPMIHARTGAPLTMTVEIVKAGQALMSNVKA